MHTAFTELTTKLQELTHLKSTLALLQWDSEVYMPPQGMASRAQTIAYLSRLLHEKFLDKDFAQALKQAADDPKLSDHEKAIIREVTRELTREKKLPADFVSELAKLTAEAPHAWAEARKQSSFAHFAPYLEKIVAMKRREAELVGFHESPYDALLDSYEPYFTTAEAFTILEEVKDFLVPFLQRIKASPHQPDITRIQGIFDAEKQRRFNEEVTKKIGFNYAAGRLDSSTHPFTMGMHPDDVRITTRFAEDDLLSALMASLHEAGHGLYEQGLSHDHIGTPLAETASLGIHESQSRLWENMVGRGRPFWEYWYPRLQQEFPQPFTKLPLDDFYRALNRVQPSLIRVEADEVTYNLHIILRFEIEKGLIEGSIAVTDLPAIWNAKMKDYLDVHVPDDAQGVLQDIHWSSGLFGYFPTYTLGTLYATQLFQAAKQDLLPLEQQIAQGEFMPLREWLKRNIHMHGKRYSAMELMQTATGQPPTAQPFIDYLTQKYSELYQLEK